MLIDMTWITKTLWTFMIRHATKATRKTFRTLVDGEELNGAELWRMLWIQNEGGQDEVEAADLGALHRFLDCPGTKVLPQYLGLWVSMAREHGGDLPGRHLTTLLLKMLPKEALDDIEKMNTLSAPYMTILKYLEKKDSPLGRSSCCRPAC